MDPLITKYPYYSPYTFSGNRIIDALELEGLEPAKYDMYLNDNLIGSTILNYGVDCHTGCIVKYTSKNEEGEVVSSYLISYRFVEFVASITGPVPMPLSEESGAPNVGIVIDGPTFSSRRSIVEDNTMGNEFSPPSAGAYMEATEFFMGAKGQNLKIGDNDKFYDIWEGNQYVKTKNVFDKQALKTIGDRLPVIGNALDGIEVVQGFIKDGFTLGKNTVIESAGVIGGAGVGWAGAVAGAAIGSSFGPVGTLVGGIIGGFLGAWGGEEAAEAVAEKSYK
jgi:hypothetical protein